MTHYAFGAFGTNNVGDEAIFWGMRRIYPDLIQIYINKSNFTTAVWYADFIEGRRTFEYGDRLTIGGGGLLYSRHAVETMIKLADMVQSVGGSVSVEGIGCEALVDDYVDLVQELVRRADKLSVRSTTSAEIIRSRTKADPTVIPDFAFNLGDLFTHSERKTDGYITIGLSLSGDAFNNQYERLCRIVERWSAGHPLVRFVHIPHSRSYTSKHNNDLIVGQLIWSSISVYHARRESRFDAIPFSVDVENVAYVYGQLDAVIAERYHGLVFGTLAGIPLVAATGNLKNQSFVKDRPSATAFSFENEDQMESKIKACIEFLQSKL